MRNSQLNECVQIRDASDHRLRAPDGIEPVTDGGD